MVVLPSRSPVVRVIKRKVGYGDEEISSTRAKLMKMELDEQSETGNKVEAGKQYLD